MRETERVEIEISFIVFPFFRDDDIVCKPAYLFLPGRFRLHLPMVVDECGRLVRFRVHDDEVFAHVPDDKADAFIFEPQIAVFFDMLQHVFRFVGHGADQAFFVAGEDERQVSVLNPVLFIAKPVPDIMFSVFFDFGQYFLQSYFFQEMIPVGNNDLCIGKTFIRSIKIPIRRDI